jgi:hypothetical protein
MNKLEIEKSESEPVITMRKINKVEIKPMKISGNKDTRPILGEEILPEIYSNVFIAAKKKSGKTCVIQEILKRCCGPSTTLIVFCSTLAKDRNWIAIQKWAKRKNIKFEGFTDLKEGKYDILDSFVRKLETEAEEELYPSEDEEEESHAAGAARLEHGKSLNLFGGRKSQKEKDDLDEWSEEEDAEDMRLFNDRPPTESEQRLFNAKPRTSIKKKEKFQSPEYIIVLDDLSHQLKSPSLISLLKKSRHMKAKIIISSQWLHDLRPESIKQQDTLLLFKGLTPDKMEKVIKDADLSIDLPTFNTIYSHATSEPFGFLYVSCREDDYRNRFDKRYEISQ